MKRAKHLLALAITAILAIAMATPAFAAGGTPSITINPDNTAADTSSLAITYTYYQILEASIDRDAVVDADDGSTGTKGVAAYYVTTQDRADELNKTGLFNVVKVDGQNKWYVELKDANTTADKIVTAFGASTFNKSVFPKGTFDKAAGETNAQSGPVDAGYYYIESSLGTKAAVQTLSDVTINEKNSYPTIKKEQGANDELAGIGDTITYKIEVKIPDQPSEKSIKLTDTITKGLTMSTDVTVTGAVASPAYISDTWVFQSTDATTGANTYTITIPPATVLANKGKTLTFTYKATVNENSVVHEEESNKAHLTYDGYTTVDSEVKTKTLAFTLQKVDGVDLGAGTTTELTGAEFDLYDAATGGNQIMLVEANGVYRVATAAEASALGFKSAKIKAGQATINGLNDQKYYLEETKAPTGYNKLESRVEAEANTTTAIPGVDYQVKNNKGATLPSTGGMGTTLIYAVGAILVIGSGIGFVARRKMNA